VVPRIRIRSSHRIHRAVEFYCRESRLADTHPNPMARIDSLGYRELYAALNLLSHV